VSFTAPEAWETSVTFTAQAEEGTTSMMWILDGQPVPNQTGTTFTATNLSVGSHTISGQACNEAGCSESSQSQDFEIIDIPTPVVTGSTSGTPTISEKFTQTWATIVWDGGNLTWNNLVVSLSVSNGRLVDSNWQIITSVTAQPWETINTTFDIRNSQGNDVWDYTVNLSFWFN